MPALIRAEDGHRWGVFGPKMGPDGAYSGREWAPMGVPMGGSPAFIASGALGPFLW